MYRLLLFQVIIIITTDLFSQYQLTGHRNVRNGEVPVEQAGIYAEAGVTYLLTNDISSETSPIFLGKNVTLDLNGYTVEFADGPYVHIPNSGFEDGLKNWDLSKAPGAKLENTADIHVFMGTRLLSLLQGDEIVSEYITLPVANRSYFAMCGVTGRYYHDMKTYPDDEMMVSIYVEDEKGKEVRCMTKYGDGIRLSCPVEKRSPRLGGGFVYAHLSELPAGKYRVRIRAETDCLVDEIDIRPAMDVGISIIGNTTPLASYDHLIMESYPPVIPAFYDYTEDFEKGKPLSGLPAIDGSGTVVIKNGTIRSGFAGIQSWGIQSSATDVKVILENILVETSGISEGAADILWADIRNCRFNTDMPFLIQRHVNLCSVLIRGNQPSEVEKSDFYGGQGCLSIKGKYSLVHDNLFVNDQWVTNHYSIMGTGDSSKIYNNRFEPRQGSGIYVSRYTEVNNNIFNIETSAPTCEYGREEYSTAAIRLGDYNAEPGSPRASVGNRIHNNKIFITAKAWPQIESYLPMAWGIFYSASGGENYVYDNDFVVNQSDTSSRVLSAALYICGGPKNYGGQFYNNQISTNVPAAWVASMYGGASNSDIYNNTISPINNSEFPAFRMGYAGCGDCIAVNVKFRSNSFEGKKFTIDASDQPHSYSVHWTLDIEIKNRDGMPQINKKVTILNGKGELVMKTRTNSLGKIKTELPEYSTDAKIKTLLSPYTIRAGSFKRVVEMNENKAIIIP